MGVCAVAESCASVLFTALCCVQVANGGRAYDTRGGGRSRSVTELEDVRILPTHGVRMHCCCVLFVCCAVDKHPDAACPFSMSSPYCLPPPPVPIPPASFWVSRAAMYPCLWSLVDDSFSLFFTSACALTIARTLCSSTYMHYTHTRTTPTHSHPHANPHRCMRTHKLTPAHPPASPRSVPGQGRDQSPAHEVGPARTAGPGAGRA